MITGRGPRGTVVVTGATGFVGRRAVAALERHGFVVRRALRAPAASPHPGDVVVGDLLDAPDWSAAVDGAHTVVHLAARVHVMREDAAAAAALYERANVAATAALLRASDAAGVRRVVLASSVKAVAEWSREPLDERTVPSPADPYGRSKLAAEHAVLAWAARGGRAGVALRLPLVYGPGVGANVRRLFAAVDRGLPVPVPRAPNARSLAYVETVADAIVRVVAAPRAESGAYFVSDGAPVSTEALVRAIALALGRPSRVVRVPGAVAATLGAAGDALARLGPWPLTSAALQRLTGSLAVRTDRFAADYAFRPRFGLQDGLRATADWYRAEGA